MFDYRLGRLLKAPISNNGVVANEYINIGTETFDHRQNRRYPADNAFYIAKELLMTERTYKKDLEVISIVRHCIFINEWFFFLLTEMLNF